MSQSKENGREININNQLNKTKKTKNDQKSRTRTETKNQKKKNPLTSSSVVCLSFPYTRLLLIVLAAATAVPALVYECGAGISVTRDYYFTFILEWVWACEKKKIKKKRKVNMVFGRQHSIKVTPPARRLPQLRSTNQTEWTPQHFSNRFFFRFRCARRFYPHGNSFASEYFVWVSRKFYVKDCEE